MKFQFTDAASGTSPDHAYGAHNIPLSYTIEMRGNGPYGNFGFVLPPQFIDINSREIFAGLRGMIEEAKRLGYLGGQWNGLWCELYLNGIKWVIFWRKKCDFVEVSGIFWENLKDLIN